MLSLDIEGTLYFLKCIECHKYECNRKDNPLDAVQHEKNRIKDPTKQRSRWGVIGTGCTSFLKMDVYQAYLDKSLTKSANTKFTIISDSLVTSHNHDVSALYVYYIYCTFDFKCKQYTQSITLCFFYLFQE